MRESSRTHLLSFSCTHLILGTPFANDKNREKVHGAAAAARARGRLLQLVQRFLRNFEYLLEDKDTVYGRTHSRTKRIRK